jgi:nitrite reductase/ring-hydroxylating ferredoxin subunit
MREIAELLVDVEASTPWLYFDSIIGYQHAMLSPDSHYHYHSCVHDVASRLHQGSYDIETGKLEEVFGQSEGSASKRTTQNQKVLGPYKFTSGARAAGRHPKV